MNQYNGLHLVMFTGKGGVGKTTLSCGFARAWAKQFPGESVLLLSADPAHSLGDVLRLPVENVAITVPDLPNLQVQVLDAKVLLQNFKDRYGQALELLVERGSFVEGEDLTPAWDMSWPGLDELMSLLEIQRLLREEVVDRVVVDMAPTGHATKLLKLMDFLDNLLAALALFQQKHRTIRQTFSGRDITDEADDFLAQMEEELRLGRQLIQDATKTGCFVVTLAEQMSLAETRRLVEELDNISVPIAGFFVNRLLPIRELSSPTVPEDFLSKSDQLLEQGLMVEKVLKLAEGKPIFAVPQWEKEPVGGVAIDELFSAIQSVTTSSLNQTNIEHVIPKPASISPGFNDFITEGCRLIIVGGKGGVGKTTVSAGISWGMASRHPHQQIRVISIDPAHSLGDAFDLKLGHEPKQITENLSAQEVNSEITLDEFREAYLWELAEMMSGESGDDNSSIKLAYSPQGWRQIVSQALPGMDEMLALISVIDLLETQEQDLIILDTAPTGHLLRFLEMPAAMSDWLAWIFKLWIKYQNVLGRTDFMSRLRSLRQRVVLAQKKLKDPKHTTFIGVIRAESAILAEQLRLSEELRKMGVSQRYLVHNCYQAGEAEIQPEAYGIERVIPLPILPRSVSPMMRVKYAGDLLFE